MLALKNTSWRKELTVKLQGLRNSEHQVVSLQLKGKTKYIDRSALQVLLSQKIHGLVAPSLLPNCDNPKFFRYDVSGKKQLSELLKCGIGVDNAVFLLQELYGCLEEAYSFGLRAECFVLRPEWVFVDDSNSEDSTSNESDASSEDGASIGCSANAHINLIYLPLTCLDFDVQDVGVLKQILNSVVASNGEDEAFLLRVQHAFEQACENGSNVYDSASSLNKFCMQREYFAGKYGLFWEERNYFTVLNEFPFCIGRASYNNLCLSECVSVSREHAKLILEDGFLKVIDCNSLNGTFVNDFKVSASDAIDFKEGQILRLGSESFILQKTSNSL